MRTASVGRRFWLVSFFLLGSVAFAKVPAKTDVVVIGAGLSGLASGYHLKKANIPFHVLEITPRIGGRVKTVKYERNGETLYSDSGMEEYWESNPAVAILKELKLPLRVDVAVSSVKLLGMLYELGDETAAQFRERVFTPEERAAWERFRKEVSPTIDELYTGQPVRPELLALKDSSFASYVGTKKLPEKVAEWIRVSLECEVGTEWDKISAIDGLAEMHIFMGAEGEKSVRVLGGNEKFTDAFATKVGKRHITLNQAVKSIRSTKDGVEVSYLDMATNRLGVVRAKKVITTVPLYRVFELQFEPPLSEAKQAAIQSMGWGAYFKAHVFVPKAAEKYWTKSGSSMLPILSDSKLGVIYDGNPDQKTKAKILSLLITGAWAESFTMMPQESARLQIKEEFEKLWPGIGKEIQEVEFYRYHPRAIAAWGVGRSRFDAQSEEIRRPENHVHLAGDFTETSHSDGAFKSAERAVKQIKEALSRKVSHQ